MLAGVACGVLTAISVSPSRDSLFGLGGQVANSLAAGTRAATGLLAGRWRFCAELTDNRNQTVDLRLVQGPSEGRHVSFPLVNLRKDLSVGELLGFGGAQILRSDGLANSRAPASVWPMALGTVSIEKFPAVRLCKGQLRDCEENQ